MVQTIKQLWNKWENLKTWQQIMLILPYLLLTIGLVLYILFPIKSKKLDIEILKNNKSIVDKQIAKNIKEIDQLAIKQTKHKEKRLEVVEKVIEKEHEAELTIKKIDAADDNLVELMAIHNSLIARARERNTNK